jgi:cytochrome c oxidase subunit 1
MKLINKPYILFWITAVLILLDNFFIQDPGSVADINIHDTYFVIAHGLVAELFALLFFIMGVSYWLFERINIDLNKTLTIIHVMGTVGIAWLYRIILVGFSLFKIESTGFTNAFVIVTFMLAFLVQPIYIVNFIIGFVKPRTIRS